MAFDGEVVLVEAKGLAIGIALVVLGLELRITTDFVMAGRSTLLGVETGVLTMALAFLVCLTDIFGCKTGIASGVRLATLISFNTGSFRIVSFSTGGGAFLLMNSSL
ncbi:MAG: hypothetical protein VYC01_07015 [Nitrospinota bacterium]|nr:hypothetical protein [Nitrospinota bacterium]